MSPSNPTDLRTRLAGIQTFPQLVAFLRDDMGWPIERESFEDLVFDFTPEELGIDAKNAAKILEIRRLRPLSSNQPWGIFFVKFEPKRLPVVALRRILSSVAIKKRASANAADRAAWQVDDLLFLSSYGDGEGEGRRISFAHFAAAKEGDDLPALKVLGWDNLDTQPHLDAVARALSQHLAWPADESDREAWREKWRAAFTLRHREVISTSKDLSIRLAALARTIRDRIKAALAIESEQGPLKKLMKAFQTALVHDLDADGFADMYAQTIAYGLLSARIADPEKKTADDFTAHMRTNPFLRELMETFLKVGGRRGKAGGPGIDFDELGVSEVVELLDDANMEAVVRDFGDKNPQEDPVIHFYELFLKEYDPEKRMRRGVFYTPRPVVSYIVRSVDELLRTEFGLEDGLADTTTWGEMAARHPDLAIPEGVSPDQDFVQILDPATGTGTFLVEVIDLIYKTLLGKWKTQGHNEKKINSLWNEYVPQHLLARLHGYELLMAPYAIAHLKIGLKLYETGYRFGSDERARVFLTNSLEPAQEFSGRFDFAIPALAHEAQAVNGVKEQRRFTVVIGNPPYSSLSQNMTDWARGIVELYFHDDAGRMEERGNRNQLQDDYVKFFRLGQMLLEASGAGALGFISNSSYTRGPWFRGMRYQLLRGFDRITLLDLHGSQAHSLDSKEGDKNVFEITTPVAIGLFRRSASGIEGNGMVAYSEIHGPREAKYARLAASACVSVPSSVLTPGKPSQWRFVPHDDSNQEEWVEYIAIPDIFLSWGAGVLTNRNGLAVARSRAELLRNARRFADLTLPDADIEAEFGFSSNYQWTTGKARQEFARSTVVDLTESYTFRPFDFQFIYWHKNIVYNMRGDKMEVFRERQPPLALMFSRNTKHAAYTNIYVTKRIADRHCLEEANVAPLYTSASGGGLFDGHRAPQRCNLSGAFLATIAERLRVQRHLLEPESILRYAYSVLHSPVYRSRFAEFLKIDFPRLPLPGGPDLFGELSGLGGELVALHLLESPTLDQPISELIGGQCPNVEKISWSRNTVWLDKTQKTGFKGVREDVWNFHIGGYQVCEKWLKDRKGRKLSKEDIEHYQRIVVAISETIRIMKEIDEVIERHGGWPGAFQTGEAKAQVAAARALPFRPRTVEPGAEERYASCVPLLPLKVVAGGFGEAQPALEEETEWVEVASRYRLRPGMFVAEVVGKSMEPEIPDGSYCLFRAPVEGSRQGKVVLAELRDAVDPESGERYTVKRYESAKVSEGESWRHAAITLKPANPEFEPIVLDARDEGRLRVVAEFLDVIEGSPAPKGDPPSMPEVAEAPTRGPKATSMDPSRGRSRAAEVAMEMAPLFREPEVPTAARTIADVDAPEAMCAIRDLFESPAGRDGLERDEAIRAIARGLGFERTGKNIYEAIDSYLLAAARRGIVETVSGRIQLVARSIVDYDRGLLKDQFLASLGGYAWTEREEAIRTFARWLGYRRTGAVINDSAKSVINGLLREGRLEAVPGTIRRSR